MAAPLAETFNVMSYDRRGHSDSGSSGTTLSEDDVRNRVRTRFPAAEHLPLRPALDELLRGAVGLEWFPGGPGPTGAPLAPGFRVPPLPAPVATAFTSLGARYRTGKDR